MSIGQSLPHDAARLHVTGAARFVDDHALPHTALHAAFGLSPVAHGVIKHIDLEAVRAAPGVVDVITAQELPFANDVSPSISDEPLLATDEVFYVGQPVFAVLATSHHAARAAAQLGRIEVDERPALLNVDDARAANSYFEGGPVTWQRGDCDTAIEKADHIVTGSVDIGGQEHFYLEGQAAFAMPQENGDMLVASSTQHPTEIQHKVADALGVPMHAVRVEARRMGGGFGGKESQGNALAVLCAVGAARTGRPVKMRYDRDDDFKITGKRHDLRIEYRCGTDAQGRILGIAFTHLFRCGWSQDLSLPVADRAMLHSDNAYFFPDIRIESHRLRTHTQSATAFRGFGGPQGMVGIERVMDHIAHQLGMDPSDVRARNYYTQPTDSIAPNTTPYGMEVEQFPLPEMGAKLLKQGDIARREAEIVSFNAQSDTIKRGLAVSPVKFGISFTLTHLNQAGALVHIYQDGSVMMNHGGTEMGQGLFQKVAQVAACELAIPMEKVRITATDTAKVPNTSATAASSGSDLNGMAVRDACIKLRNRLCEVAAENLGCTVDELSHSVDGFVAPGGRALAFDDVVKKAYLARVSLSATGFYKTPKLEWDRLKGRGRPFLYFAYGIAATEVAIDTLTGEHRILRTDIVHDCGNSLNPAIDIGQIEGAYVQGAGWLTTEELFWDDKGRLRTHAPSTYKIPACSDRPDEINIALWHDENPENTVGRSKAVGEPPFMLGISAWLALGRAVAACGPNWHDLKAPATPEAVLAAIARARA